MLNVDNLSDFNYNAKHKSKNIFNEPKYKNTTEFGSNINTLKMNTKSPAKILNSSHTTANLKTYNVDLTDNNKSTEN